MAKDRRKLQHIHSSIADRQPTPQTLEVGEIAVNNAANKEFLSIKNTNNEVKRFSSDEQMITWMEKKEVVPYVGQVRGDTYTATTADTHGSVGITNDDLLSNKSNIVVKMNQVAAANTPKYDKINGAKDIYGHYVNLDVDGTVQGAGFSIDMSRYAMIGANPTFSSLTVTDKTDLSGNTTIANGDGTGTRTGHALTIKTTDVVATNTNWTETITNKNETITAEVANISGRTTTIGNNNEVLHVIGTTTETHDKQVTINNKANVNETTDGTLTELIKTNNYRDVNGNYSGTTGGTTTEVKTKAVSETNLDTTSIVRYSAVTETDKANRTLNVSGNSTTNVGTNVIENTTGTTTIDRYDDVSVNNRKNVTEITSGTTNIDRQGAVTANNQSNVTEITSGNTLINHSGTTNYNYTGGTTLSGSTLASTTTGNTSLNVSGNTSVKTVGTTTLDSTGTTTIQSTGNGSDVLIYAKDNLTATATTITATSSDNTTVNVGKNLTENITGNTTVTTTGNTLITSPTDGKSITISEIGKNGIITIKTPGDSGVTNIESLGSAGKINIKANESNGEVSVVGWAISNSAYTSTTRADYVDITGSTEVNISGGTVNTNASTSVTNYDSAYTSASTATTIIGTADTKITSAKTVITTADTSATTATLSGDTLTVYEKTSLTYSGGTLTSTTTGNTTFNASGNTTINTTGNTTIQSTGNGSDVNIYAKDVLTLTGNTIEISATTSATTKAATATTSASTVNITGSTTLNLTGQTVNVDASTSTTEVTSAYTSISTANTTVTSAKTNITNATTTIGTADTTVTSAKTVITTANTTASTASLSGQSLTINELNTISAKTTASGSAIDLKATGSESKVNIETTGASASVNITGQTTNMSGGTGGVVIKGSKLSGETTGDINLKATGEGADIYIYAKDTLKETGTTVEITATNSATTKAATATTSASTINITGSSTANLYSDDVNISGKSTVDITGVTIGASGDTINIGTNTYSTTAKTNNEINIGSSSAIQTGATSADTETYRSTVNVDGNTNISGDTVIGGTLNVPNHDMTVSKTLFLTNTGDTVSGSVTPPALVIGESGGTHLEFDNNEIMAKTTSALTSTDKLYLQSDGGYVIMSENDGRVGIGTSSPAYKLDVSGSIRATSQLISTVATGTAPLSVASTTVVTNLNADKLDGHDDSYFVYTGRSVSTASGLTGGGNLSSDRTIGLAATGTAGTYGPSEDVTGNEGATIKIPQIVTDDYGRVTSVTERTYTSKNSTYTVNNGTFSISGASTSVATFTANQSGDTSLIITGGTNVTVTPDATNHKITISSTDTNTHRPIKVGGNDFLGNNTTALDLRGGTNVTVSTGDSGVVTIAATDTTYSADGTFIKLSSGTFSAQTGTTDSTLARGDHSHDTYVKKAGDTMTGKLSISVDSGNGLEVAGSISASSAIYSSDIRLKENIQSTSVVEKANAAAIEIKRFNFKNDETKRTIYGVIAQEVEERHLDNIVITGEDGMKGVDYTSLSLLKIAYLEDKVQKLEAMINQLMNNKQ